MNNTSFKSVSFILAFLFAIISFGCNAHSLNECANSSIRIQSRLCLISQDDVSNENQRKIARSPFFGEDIEKIDSQIELPGKYVESQYIRSGKYSGINVNCIKAFGNYITPEDSLNLIDGLVIWMYLKSNNVTIGNTLSVMPNYIDNIVSDIANIENQATIELDPMINPIPVLSFDGVDDRYSYGINIPLPFTFFLVMKPQKNSQNFFLDSQNRMVALFNPISSGTIGSGAAFNISTPSDWLILSFVSADNSIQIYKNGILIAEKINNRDIQNILRIGSDWGGNRTFGGNIAEIMAYEQELDSVKLSFVNEYLFEKYSPIPELGQSKTLLPSCPLYLTVTDQFTSYSWYKIIDGSENLIQEGGNSLLVSDSGMYILESTSVFNRIARDSVSVLKIDTDGITDAVICEGIPVFIDLSGEIPDSNIEWSDPSLTGSQVEITEPGDYSVEIIQASGCSYQSPIFTISDIDEITEIEMPELFCLGNSIETEAGTYNGVSLLWSTGETSNSIVPQASGEYWVEATDINGCIGRDTIDVDIVGTAPYVEFTSGTACEDNAVVFNDITFPEGATITSQDWIFNSGQSSAEGGEVENVFPGTGTYSVELTVTLDNGCTGTGRDSVTVNPLPLVGFNYDSVTPCRGNEVAFESQSGVPGNGAIQSYAWTFGNGTSAVGVVGTTVFEEMGTNTVQLAVTTTKGCVDSLLANVVVLGSPVADFDYTDVCVGQAMAFTEEVNTEESGSVFYNWQFGDGYFSNFPNTSHVYASAGVYNVQLTATGNDFGSAGCMDQITKAVRVYAPPTGAIATTDGCLGTGIEFTDLTQPVDEGGIEDPVVDRSWVLPFGSSQGPVVLGSDSVEVWMPEVAGVYAVNYSFETEAGCTGSASGTVEVLDIPESAFSLEVPEQMPPLVVVPVNMSTGAEGYSWLLDGDEVSNAFEPEILLPDTGGYTVGLAAVNSLGCNDTIYQSVTVISPVYDIALLDIRYVISGDRLVLKALLANNGNTEIRNFKMDVELGLSANVRSEESFSIPAGDVAEYVLPQDFEYLGSRDLPYVCLRVEVVVDGELVVEADTGNNYACIGLEKDAPVFIDPYPNPGSGVVNLGFVLPKGGTVGLSVVDGLGREVGVYSWDLLEGYSLEGIDVSGYAEGSYVLRFGYNGGSYVQRLVVVEGK